MKLKVWFRDQEIATGQVNDDKVVWDGPKVAMAENLARHYQTPGMSPEELLEVLQKRLRGNWHAEKEGRDASEDSIHKAESGPRGVQRWRDPETGRVTYTDPNEPGDSLKHQ